MQRCLDVRAACGDAIAWIETNRRQASRLDRESASLVLRLRRTRNRARALARASARPFAIGFFGLSQAGKSYLISAFAANDKGTLDIALGSDRLSFLTHINPPGGGKEATGLVTRLTRAQQPSPAGFPVRLNLFSEADLVKVLGNAFFNDFDPQLPIFDVDAAKVRAHLANLEARRRNEPLPGVDADDVVELQDYFDKRFPRSIAPLRADFWPTAASLAPYLSGDDRAELFSVLWGTVPELTALFRLLRDTLARLQFEPTVYSELSAVVTRTDGDEWTPNASIVDVDILERLGKDMDDTLRVIPAVSGTAVDAVSVPRSVLAALTAEIELLLADPPKAELLETMDLLDFPGYRGRLSIGILEDVRKQLRDDQLDPLAQLVLRGKVAYLFERYTEDQEMNALVLCTPSNQQSDVNDLGPVLESWIQATQGPDPQARAQHRPGLLWALTKFDQRLDVVPGQTADLMRSGWEGMMKLTLLERFGGYDWLHEWTPGRRFDNLFLVRKPGKAGAVVRTEGEQEMELLASRTERLALLRKTFCEHPIVRTYIRDPDVAWDAMLKLNDGGISRLTEYLTLVADPEERLRGIRQQIDDLAAGLADNRLRAYHTAQGIAGVDAKKRIVAQILHPLSRRPRKIGDLLYLLQPSREQLRGLYLRTNIDDDADADAYDDLSKWTDADVGAPLDISDILGQPESKQPRATHVNEANDRAARFAREAVRDWVVQLQELADDVAVQKYFGLPQAPFEALINELITGADRHRLEQLVTAALRENESLAGTLREQLAARQVDLVYSVLCGFIDYLEAFEMPRDIALCAAGGDAAETEGIDAHRRPEIEQLFAAQPLIVNGELPKLPREPDEDDFASHFTLDWFRALKVLAVNNAGYKADQEFTPEQNLRLGEILDALKGDTRTA